MYALTAESAAESMATVGDKLRLAREEARLSLDYAADQTKIRKDHLEALEAGDFDVFAAPIYVRGFVRTYSRMLGLNAPQILLELDQELGRSRKFADAQRFTQEKTPVDFLMLQLSKINWRVALPLFAVALLLLLGLLGYRSWARSQSEDPLKNLGPGLYQGKPTGEVLPLPRPRPRPAQPAPQARPNQKAR